MDHFRVLPTDQRYLDLTETQIQALFFNHLQTPDSLSVKRAYRKQREKDRKAQEIPEDALKAQGWSDEEIEDLRETIRQGRGVE
jgi:hypothetical protein